MKRTVRQHALVPLLGSCILLAAPTFASAEITIEQGQYAAGVLEVRGETSQPDQQVTLDGRYTEWTNRYGRFTFRVRYMPNDCIVQIRAGQEVRPVYITNCEPVAPRLETQREMQRQDRGASPTASGGAALRVVRQQCERGNECMVVCREQEVALNAVCPGGSADFIDERSIACRQPEPGRIIAYCMSPAGP